MEEPEVGGGPKGVIKTVEIGENGIEGAALHPEPSRCHGGILVNRRSGNPAAPVGGPGIGVRPDPEAGEVAEDAPSLDGAPITR